MGLPLLLQEASRPKIVFIGRDPAKIRKKLAEGGIDVRMLPNTVEAGECLSVGCASPTATTGVTPASSYGSETFPNHNSLSLRLKQPVFLSGGEAEESRGRFWEASELALRRGYFWRPLGFVSGEFMQLRVPS